ncbi:MAG: ABC transporter permease [Planctomycetota bacterium]
MKVLDLLSFSSGALVMHRLRSLLSLVGVAIGVAAVVVLTSLGEGARRYVRGQFESLGTNLLIVLPGKVETTGAMPGMGGAPNDLTLGDVEALRRGIPFAKRIVPIAMGSETVSHAERRRQVAIVGATAGFLEARRLAVAAGRFLPESDMDRGAPVAVLGCDLARELFRADNPLGGLVRVGEWRMRVIGVLEPRGMQLGLDLDDLAIVPVASAMRMFNRRSLFRVLVEVNSPAQIDLAKERTLAILAARHGEEDVTCVTQDSVAGALAAILAVLTLALAGIAGISLSVAGIGIMNVMLVSVSERTPEVGLLRAVGAQRGDVRLVFLAEAGMLAVVGGAVGLILAWVATRVLELLYPAFPATPPAWAVVAALLVSLVVGLVFGVLPAMRATRLDPVAALSRQ